MFRGRLILFAALALAASAPAPAAAADQLMDWSAPLQLDTGSPLKFAGGAGIDCAGNSFCVAAGGAGRLLVSTDPTGGREAWEAAEVDPSPAALTAVSCPSAGFCAVADAEGNLLTSAEPQADAAAWSSAAIDAGHAIVSVSCPSAGFCAAVDDAGQVLVSDEPDGGAAAWSAGAVVTGEPQQISCASTSLCALAYDGFNSFHEPPGLLISTDPLAGAGSWTDSGLDLGENGEVFGVSCPSDEFCGLAYPRGILVSTEPAGGASTWHLTQSVAEAASPGATQLNYVEGLGITCSSADFCVAQLSYSATQSFYPSSPKLLISSQPTSKGSWALQTMNREWDFGFAEMVCTGPSFCATVGKGGLVSTSTEPAGGEEAWRLQLIPMKGPTLTSVACPAQTFCAATGTGGRLYTSTDPPDPGSWTATRLAEYIESVTCSSPTWCTVAADGPAGNTVMYATEPAAGVGAWSAVPRRTGRALTCPEPGFCAQLADYHDVLASDEPLAGSASWTVTDMKLPDWRLGPNVLGVIACPAADLCATGGDVSTMLTSSDPVGGRAAWIESFVGGASVEGLTCPTTSFCAATTWSGTVATTTDPLGGTSAWKRSNNEDAYFLGPISCAADASLCVSIEQHGNAVTSRSPQDEVSEWGTFEPIYEGEGLRDVSCAVDGSLCTVISWDGEVIVGTPRPEMPGGESEGEGGGSAPGGSPGAPPPPAPPHPCHKPKRHKAKRGPAIAPHHKVSSGGKRSKSRCARPR